MGSLERRDVIEALEFFFLPVTIVVCLVRKAVSLTARVWRRG